MNNVIPIDLLQAVSKITGTSDVAAFQDVLLMTIMPNGSTAAQCAAFLMVAKEYNLNPVTKEIFAFPSNGKINPIVSIDGWIKIINGHAQFDGMEYLDNKDEGGALTSITCKIFRKDRTRATEVTEYMHECQGKTEPWNRFPARMLRHKATIQAARYAFGFSGIIDPDEADRISPSVDDIVVASVEYITGEQITELRELMNQANKAEAQIVEWLLGKAIEDEDIESAFKKLTKANYERGRGSLIKEIAKQENENKKESEEVAEAVFTEQEASEDVTA